MLVPPNRGEGDNLYVKLAKNKAVAGLTYLKKTYSKFDAESTADFQFLDANFNAQYIAEQKQEKLAMIFTILAIIISCLGLFGIVMFITAQRKKEIGVRKVLGASVTSVSVGLGKEFGKLVALAAIMAFPISWFVMERWLEDFAYHIEMKWWMFLVSGAIAVFVALVTVGFQTVKAASANPMKSLRAE